MDIAEKVNDLQDEGKLHEFAYKFVDNKHEADDLIQDAIYKILKHRKKFKKNSNFNAWVYTIIKNQFVTNNRKKKVRYSAVADVKEDIYSNISRDSDVDRPDVQYGHKDLIDKISLLNRNIREPFKMFLEGYKYNEIADELNIPVGTVKSRINSARKKLKENFTVNY